MTRQINSIIKILIENNEGCSLLIERRVKLSSYIARVDRIKRGKIQRKKLMSIRKGYKVVGKRIKRMSTSEIRRRKIAMRRAVFKRRNKRSKSLLKRRLSYLRGKRLGLYK